MEAPRKEKDYYVLNAELLIAGIKEFLKEKHAGPLTDQHIIEMLSTPIHVLLPMLEKSDKAAGMIDALLEDYNHGSTDRLEEIMITARHQFSIHPPQTETNLPVKKVKDEIKELFRIYKF